MLFKSSLRKICSAPQNLGYSRLNKYKGNSSAIKKRLKTALGHKALDQKKVKKPLYVSTY